MFKKLLYIFISVLTFTSEVSCQNVKVPNSISFLNIGDWGNTGVSKLKNEFEKQANLSQVDFVILAGDNFYMNGVKSVTDPLWNKFFKGTFNGPYLSKTPFYAILGNHDLGYNSVGNVTAQIEYNKIDKRWNMPDRWYTKIFSPCKNIKIPCQNNFTAQIVFIDTAVAVPKNFPIFGHPELSSLTKIQLEWFKKTLQSSTADWLIVVGHYQMFVNQGDNQMMINALKKIMVDNKVDAYFCGHIHNLQILQYGSENTRYYISGAGMTARTDNPELKSKATQIFFNYKKLGFMKHILTKGYMNVTVHYNDGAIPYTYVQKAFRNVQKIYKARTVNSSFVTLNEIKQNDISKIYVEPVDPHYVHPNSIEDPLGLENDNKKEDL